MKFCQNCGDMMSGTDDECKECGAEQEEIESKWNVAERKSVEFGRGVSEREDGHPLGEDR